MRWGVEVFHTLKGVLKKRGYNTAVGDEGGFAPSVKSNVEAIEVVLEAISKAGYKPGEEIAIALDPAASAFYQDGKYVFKKSDKSSKSSDDMVRWWAKWAQDYPIVSIEDGLSEQDWDCWANLTKELGGKIQLVGDDLFVTNVQFLQEGIDKHVANSILIKVNQIGTVSETLDAIDLARRNGLPWDAILGAEIAGDYKHKPRVYLAAAEAFDLAPADCMLVAANTSDLQAAAALGLRTAHIARPDERGPGKGEAAPSAPVDIAAASLEDLAAKLGT